MLGISSTLQSASSWWYGGAPSPAGGLDTNEVKSDEKEEAKDDFSEKVTIALEKNVKCLKCRDHIIVLFQLVDLASAIKQLLKQQFGDQLTEKECTEILALFTAICDAGVPTKGHFIIYSEELFIAEIIMSYFSSYSETNPDAIGCWDRWLKYRLNKDISQSLKTVSHEQLQKFYGTQSNAVGFARNNKLIWFTSTENYDGYIDNDTQRKGMILLLTSFYWNRKNDKLDLNVLRGGIYAFMNLSHWTINLIGLSTMYAIKDAMVAFPYTLHDIFIYKPPMLIYLVKSVAAQFFVSHALDKFVFLDDSNAFFQQHADKPQTPTIADGSNKLLIEEWMRDRGYI
eukprot:CAMPEP_0202713954 /NCGR_PEP_ID=MMETSP1385-20130828/62004_1 /ASSEMBLY_ACC=CAM_ASM_000861 /TAXON_ID=933848 /ORGANISM="Elphidium margaritaceum" /LENGTH=341 /DNA_ID=CAMNT_0049374511 /DNA_START=26 /DNA_END=1051 /DNA_ORIENTATION=-